MDNEAAAEEAMTSNSDDDDDSNNKDNGNDDDADNDRNDGEEDQQMDGLDQAEIYHVDDYNFAEIPELPVGYVLRFELLSPWDDPSFVGLAGIELFNENGVRPIVQDIWTNAADSSGDLRALVDGQQQQHSVGSSNKMDSAQMWLCNYRHLTSDSAEPIHISIRFNEDEPPQTLAMIRIWNYADSRVHSLRGVRHLRIWLDHQCIFQGEICCAYGSSGQSDAPQGDTILFTTNEEILAKIAEHDEAIMELETTTTITKSPQEEFSSLDISELPAKLKMPSEQQGLIALLALQQKQPKDQSESAELPENCCPSHLTAPNRPTTGHTTASSASSSASSTAAGRIPTEAIAPSDGAKMQENEGKAVDGGICLEEEVKEEEDEENFRAAKVFHIELLANWGSPDSIGLTGIQFLGPRFEPLNEVIAKECQVRCEPAIEEMEPGERLTNLLNGRNLTCRQEEMWKMRWDPPSAAGAGGGGPNPVLSFTFPHEVRISGVSIWNYNANAELSYAGVRCARFYANGRPINGIGSVLLRKAPGFVFFDFVQDILFDRCPLIRPLSSRPHTKSVAAFIFQLRLLTSWGDDFYIGLNGIELFNRRDQPIRLRPQNLAAFPESVNCLAAVNGTDPRTSDKLIDGIYDTTKAHHMWLTPILPNSFARVFIIFDTPTFVTRIRIYNYRKTPTRGVRHIALSADDLLLCSGAEVPMSTMDSTGILDIPLRDSE